MHFSDLFGGEISYFARSEKEWARMRKDIAFLPLDELLAQSEALFCCLNKNTVLLHEAELQSWVIKDTIPTGASSCMGTKNRLSNGYQAVTLFFAIPSGNRAMLTFRASMYRAYELPRRAAPARRSTITLWRRC